MKIGVIDKEATIKITSEGIFELSGWSFMGEDRDIALPVNDIVTETLLWALQKHLRNIAEEKASAGD